MATPGGTPTPDLPPLGIWSGLPLIPCPECGDAVEEYIPGLGGTITNPSSCRRNETGVRGGCSFFKTKEEYEAILRDRGLLGPAATPEQGQGTGYLIPEPVGNPEMVAAMEDLKHEMVAQKLAIAELKTDIQDFKGKFGAGDKVQKVAKTDSIARLAKAIVKWFFVANVVVLLFGVVVAMSVK
ncbi:unnamed protein product [Miscanthus lutarioriparius]|uniref:Uncharacterized protein n=1 Tax=Miscanthus lutarioriparius TaxID=422564 RepID=A0A811RII6_9POAL|nr:unnamed protein product [Miscanthus lutarioriparius]